jgi:hypothetical protein
MTAPSACLAIRPVSMDRVCDPIGISTFCIMVFARSRPRAPGGPSAPIPVSVSSRPASLAAEK